MNLIVGAIIVIGCVLGGYVLHHGDLRVLWQPTEVIIIGGAALGAFIIANRGHIIKGVLSGVMGLFKGEKYSKAFYTDLLIMLYATFKAAKTKGVLALESHIEDPYSSEFFKKFDTIAQDHHLMDFFTDYLRLITMGTTNPNQMEDLLNAELDAHHKEAHQIPAAISAVADGMPALGIVAAVLGVIVTMGSIDQPPTVLGKLIGAALVGTFLGVLLSYGYIAPMATAVNARAEAEGRVYEVIKIAIVAYLQGHAPAVAVEFARKTIFHEHRPTFGEVEEKLQNAPAL